MTTGNFELVAGDDLDIAVTVTENSAIKNLTGATIIWKMGRNLSAAPVLTKSVGSGVTITDAPNGLFTIALQGAETLALKGEYLHEAQVTDAGGNVLTVLTGRVTVRPGLIA